MSPDAVNAQEPIVFEINRETLQSGPSPSDRFVYSSYFKPTTIEPLPEDADPHDVEVLKQILSSELGFLFLDRTRIRPQGFALGEHLQSLSLAPGEEVVLEQRTFSKRETSFEDLNEEERTYDLEMSSTLTTELAEGLERELTRSEQEAFQAHASLGANVELPIPETPIKVGADVKADASYSRTVNQANSQSRKRSVKDSATTSSKVASKYRAMHKTTLRVASEDRFESTSKRVIRNPNRYTPVDLQYFKILRRLEIVQERYGLRLCWAPSVDEPAADVIRRIELERNAIMERAVAAVELPPRPPEPAKPDKPARIEQSAVTEADKWGLTGDMSADYDISIDIPVGYTWNGDIEEVGRLTQVWGRPSNNMGWYVVGAPWVANDKLMVRIHVGAGSWIGGPKVFMQAKAKFIPAAAEDDPEYRARYQQWLGDVKRWEAEVAAKLEPARARARAQADEWERAMLATLNPVAEVMSQIVKAHLLGPLSDERWEVDFWTEVFDWELAGVTLSPGYWSSRPARNQLLAPNHFLNATSAKLYLPVKPGFERLALRWIVGRVRDGELDPETESAFWRIQQEMQTYRHESFGSPDETQIGGEELKEKFIVLARWNELLPTDGTHMEVVQAMTTAIDSDSHADLERERQLLTARVTGEQQDVELKKKAVANIDGSPSNKINYSVEISTEDREATSGRTVT